MLEKVKYKLLFIGHFKTGHLKSGKKYLLYIKGFELISFFITKPRIKRNQTISLLSSYLLNNSYFTESRVYILCINTRLKKELIKRKLRYLLTSSRADIKILEKLLNLFDNE